MAKKVIEKRTVIVTTNVSHTHTKKKKKAEERDLTWREKGL